MHIGQLHRDEGRQNAQQNFMRIPLQTLDLTYTSYYGENTKKQARNSGKCTTKGAKYIEMFSKTSGMSNNMVENETNMTKFWGYKQELFRDKPTGSAAEN